MISIWYSACVCVQEEEQRLADISQQKKQGLSLGTIAGRFWSRKQQWRLSSLKAGSSGPPWAVTGRGWFGIQFLPLNTCRHDGGEESRTPKRHLVRMCWWRHSLDCVCVYKFVPKVYIPGPIFSPLLSSCIVSTHAGKKKLLTATACIEHSHCSLEDCVSRFSP